ncbi:MAG: hypothetical protein WCZ86_03925 [Desulfurivibrionaceae bacterium]|jgi:hypothetical protein
MECACVESCGDEYAESTHTEIIFAINQVKCGECYRIIQPGEQYELCTLLFEGEWSRCKTCLDCRSVTAAFFCGFTFETVWEDLGNSLLYSDGRFPEDKVHLLTPVAREKVFALLEDIWADMPQDE